MPYMGPVQQPRPGLFTAVVGQQQQTGMFAAGAGQLQQPSLFAAADGQQLSKPTTPVYKRTERNAKKQAMSNLRMSSGKGYGRGAK